MLQRWHNERIAFSHSALFIIVHAFLWRAPIAVAGLKQLEPAGSREHARVVFGPDGAREIEAVRHDQVIVEATAFLLRGVL